MVRNNTPTDPRLNGGMFYICTLQHANPGGTRKSPGLIIATVCINWYHNHGERSIITSRSYNDHVSLSQFLMMLGIYVIS